MGNLFSHAGNQPQLTQDPEIAILKALFSPNEFINLQRTFAHLAAESGQGLILQSILSERLRLVPAELSDGPLTRKDNAQLAEAAQSLGNSLATIAYTGWQDSTLDWTGFLRGTAACCKENSSTAKVSLLASLFASCEPGDTAARWLNPQSLQRLLLVSWLMICQVQLSKTGDGGALLDSQQGAVRLVDIDSVVEGFREHVASQEKVPGSCGKDRMWVADVASWCCQHLPGLVDCVSDYVHQRLISDAPMDQSGENERRKSAQSDSPEAPAVASTSYSSSSGLLSTSTAWILGLTQRGPLSHMLLAVSCHPSGWVDYHPRLLYRSSHNGRGISRFLAAVEGYKGTSLLVLSATLKPGDELSDCPPGGQRWSMAAISPTGFENKTSFYGGGGCCLVVLEPSLLTLRPQGRESNFIYSHGKLPGQGYRSSPKPQGLGFGGSSGKERVWVDDEFLTVTVRHHAVDKTYQHGSVVPGQRYGTVESSLDEMEVWGLAGSEADAVQLAYRQREQLFKEQRGKVDLKSFGSGWETSPDKIIMDLMSDPNKDVRVDR